MSMKSNLREYKDITAVSGIDEHDFWKCDSLARYISINK